MFGSAAHDRRRTEEIRSCRTLNDLHNVLTEMGYKISRSATYLRLMPRNFSSLKGKRHIKTVPVKLCRAQNSMHKTHPDSKFCISSIRYVESLASLLGPAQASFISQDDKARVPIGLTAAQKQSPMLMHLEYRVKLPDHDWVIAEKHKLIPSVYAGIIIEENGLGSPEAVKHSGPTFIAIRSVKHSSSTAASHAQDFSRLIELPEFDVILKTNNMVKPVLIFSVDGGPDENPRYPKTISFAIKHFKEYNLDALFIVTNAPGRSAKNRVERRMAPLSKQLSGLILRHDVHGTHLDSKGKTMDSELEIKNFECAGKTLAEVWSELVIDGHPVIAEYKNPTTNDNELEYCDANWYANHVRESQYFLQTVTCKNLECCGELRSDIHSVLVDRFFPAPCLIAFKNGRIQAPLPNAVNYEKEDIKFLPLFQRLSFNISISHNFIHMPYDFYCSSIQSQLKERCCNTCGLYFASKKAATAHKRYLKHNLNWSRKNIKITAAVSKREDEILCITRENKDEEIADWMDHDDVWELQNFESTKNELISKITNESGIPIIDSIDDWLSNPFTNE